MPVLKSNKDRKVLTASIRIPDDSLIKAFDPRQVVVMTAYNVATEIGDELARKNLYPIEMITNESLPPEGGFDFRIISQPLNTTFNDGFTYREEIINRIYQYLLDRLLGGKTKSKSSTFFPFEIYQIEPRALSVVERLELYYGEEVMWPNDPIIKLNLPIKPKFTIVERGKVRDENYSPMS